MPKLRTLAIAMAGAGILPGLTLTAARACDNDRYPCPIVSPAPDATEPAKSPARKKASRAARQDDKSRAKTERQASHESSHAKAIAPAEQPIISAPQKAPDPSAALNNAVDRESPASAAAAAGVVPSNTAAAAAEPTAVAETAAAPSTSEVKVVDPHELNELDLAAASAPTAESSWLSYLLMTLGAALAAASGLRFLFV
jgi:hypothetical protein